MRVVFITAAVGLGLGLALTFLLGGSGGIGWCMLGVLIVLPLVGVLVTIDDDLPGGWSNPNGRVKPPVALLGELGRSWREGSLERHWLFYRSRRADSRVCGVGSGGSSGCGVDSRGSPPDRTASGSGV